MAYVHYMNHPIQHQHNMQRAAMVAVGHGHRCGIGGGFVVARMGRDRHYEGPSSGQHIDTSLRWRPMVYARRSCRRRGSVKAASTSGLDFRSKCCGWGWSLRCCRLLIGASATNGTILGRGPTGMGLLVRAPMPGAAYYVLQDRLKRQGCAASLYYLDRCGMQCKRPPTHVYIVLSVTLHWPALVPFCRVRIRPA